MNLQCKACGHKFRLSDDNATKFAGRRVKCPGCKEPISVPGAAPAKQSSPKLPQAAPLSAKPPAAKPPATTKPPAAAPAAPAAAQPADNGFPSFDTNAVSSGASSISTGTDARSPLSRVKKSKKSSPPLGLILGAGGAVAALLLIVVGLAVMSNQSDDPSRDSTKVVNNANGSNLKVNGKGELTLNWPESERKGAKIQVDGTEMELPASGPISYLIASGQHKLVIRRRNYLQIEAQIVVPEKDSIAFTPSWKQGIAGSGNNGMSHFGNTTNVAQGGFNPDANFDNWLQDFEKAKATAGNQKDIMLVFNASDWHPHAQQFAREVLFDRRFNTLVGGEYVMVNIDFPKRQAAMAEVENEARNESLREYFEVEQFPLVIFTDSEGLPYAKVGYQEGGVAKFLEQIELAQSVRQNRDDLIRLSEQGSWQERRQYSEIFVSEMSDQDLHSYYSKKYQEWFDAAREADPNNRLGHNEHFFQFIWLARLSENARLGNEAGLRTVAEQLDEWNEKYDFRNQDLAAIMYLRAAKIMYDLKDPEAVTHFATAGMEFTPSDPDLANALGFLSSMGDSINILGNGTGFVIAEGGYIMTNHHVIEGGGKLAVRLPGMEELIPCKVVAQNEEHDLALVKVDHEAMKEIPPLSITLLPPELANKISVLGYPLSDSLGNQVKFTSGEIAATADLQRNGMLLLDCTVNPGNSGGPLFNTAGNVIGIVTAKSVSRDGSEDTYGMAVTANRAVEFLEQHLPGYQPPAATKPADLDSLPPNANWSSVIRGLKGSVLQIVMLRE